MFSCCAYCVYCACFVQSPHPDVPNLRRSWAAFHLLLTSSKSMARIAHAPAQSSPEPTDEGPGSSTSSPGRSVSSDKENHEASRRNSSRTEKRKQGRAMASGQPAASSNSSVNKRRRLAERTANTQIISQSQTRRSQVTDKDFYDPDQDEKERRRIRKGLRDLSRELHGNILIYILC